MSNKQKNYLLLYIVTLFFFSVAFLYIKHEVGNDSTISEWFINYSGGFTKRGIIGQISIFFSELFDTRLRYTIFIFQAVIVTIYFIIFFINIRKQFLERYFLLALFTPIFLLYPIAEIEVLARKEVFIFIIFIIYSLVPNQKTNLIILSKITLLPLSVLIWEPIVFFLPFFIFFDLINPRFKWKINNCFKELLLYLPTLLIVCYFIFSPMSNAQHAQMEFTLKNDFNEICYMSCNRLLSVSTIYDQFKGNLDRYSFVVFFRYFLIILIGFGPLFILAFNSSFKNNQLILFGRFKNLLSPILLCLSPVILLFAMGYDWGRWVNISYVFSILFYLYLYKNNEIILNKNFLDNRFLNFLKYKKVFIVFFIIYCFGWNPKTIITGDVGSKPGYQIPRKAIKIIYYKYLKD